MRRWMILYYVNSSVEEDVASWPPFPEVSHTQQKEEGTAPWNLKEPQVSVPNSLIYCYTAFLALKFSFCVFIFSLTSNSSKGKYQDPSPIYLTDL